MDCPHCDKKISTHFNLMRHIKNAHSDREIRENYSKKRKLDGTLSASDNESEGTHSDATVSENEDSESEATQSDDDERNQSDSDTNDEDQMSAWKWFAYKAAEHQNGQTAADIINLVNGSSTSKVFMDNLRTIISNHRRLHDNLTQGDIYSKILNEELHFETHDDGYNQVEAQKCAWRKRKYLVKDYLNEIFNDQ